MRASVAISFLVAWCGPASALDWTAATVFLCDEDGTVIPAGRWNTGPVDAAWDIFIYEGEPVGPKAGPPERIRWLNGDDHRIRVPLRPGTRTYAFHFDSTSPLPRLGMNLFFDGQEDRPGISVVAGIAGGGPADPAFQPNGAAVTMGPPIADVRGAGTLCFDAGDGGLATFDERPEALRVTLKEFRILEPGPGAPDLVGPHAIERSGTPDHVGRFTLAIERCVPRPPEPFLWLRAVAGLSAGAAGKAEDGKKAFGGEAIAPPFSFVYDGVPSEGLLDGWKKAATSKAIDEHRTASTLTFTDPRTGLAVRWEGLEYRDFRTVEWTVYFRNTGDADTPILSDVRALDVEFRRRPAEEFILRHWKGTFVRRDDYEPLATALEPSESIRFAPPGGRPCGRVFPYYNLESGGEGMIIVVGWAGQWAAQFACDADRGLRVTAGQETTEFTLRPGEEVRTPLIVLQPWKRGDWIDAQNAWRRWMIRYNLPRPGGELPPVPQLAACSSHQFAEMIHANEENQKLFVDRYLEEGLKLDYWWMDAGWYVNERGWPHTGTWEVDGKRFPNGLRAISDHARAKGVKTIVWFEPERVAAGTWLSREHPEWIIGGAGGGLLDLGIPEARAWLTKHIDGIISREGIDLYRQDYNIDPLGAWRAKDGPGRQGIAENLYVQGYLAYWDELRRRHPDMLIDSCASGGHRNDLETMRRAVPLLRSDYIFEPVGQQGHTYGLAFWLPFFGTAVSAPRAYDPYTYRSNMCPHNTACFDVRDRSLDYDLIRRLDGQWRAIAPFTLGDYYPLTPYSVDEASWLAWQFHRPEAGDGVVQAFRRSKSIFCAAELVLRGLDPDARYEIRDFDAPENEVIATGADLMAAGKGLRVEIPVRPGAAVVSYKRLQAPADERSERPASPFGCAPWGLRPAHSLSSSAITGFRRTPIPSISTSTVSPAFSHTGGFRANPQPAGVPVRRTVPGRSVMPEER
ncbi:MAG: alpha-galactosidase [Planctomycetes bacterium]|nr:alpha-galactosidase [Planctomycetota bacterium]